MGFLEGLAYDFSFLKDVKRNFVVSSKKNRCQKGEAPKPLESFGVSKKSEIIQMPVFVCNDVIDHDHLIQCRYHIYAKFQTAIHIMLIYGYIVFFLRV